MIPKCAGEPHAVRVDRLVVQETALLQTFPNNYEWPKDVKLARKLVGNAVPPRVARLLLGAEA